MIGLMMLAVAATSDPTALYLDGNQIFEHVCNGTDRGKCALYTIGIYSGDSLARARAIMPQLACPVWNTTPMQLGDVVAKWLVDHPERRAIAGATWS